MHVSKLRTSCPTFLAQLLLTNNCNPGPPFLTHHGPAALPRPLDTHLLRVKPRVTVRVVAAAEVGVLHSRAAADALGHVVACGRRGRQGAVGAG